MNPRDWRITAAACRYYAHAMRRGGGTYSRAQVEREMRELFLTASLRDTARDGRELWRCSKRVGRGLRVVVANGEVKWVGHGVPPARLWRPTAEPALPTMCRHAAAGELEPVVLVRSELTMQGEAQGVVYGDALRVGLCALCFGELTGYVMLEFLLE